MKCKINDTGVIVTSLIIYVGDNLGNGSNPNPRTIYLLDGHDKDALTKISYKSQGCHPYPLIITVRAQDIFLKMVEVPTHKLYISLMVLIRYFDYHVKRVARG